MFRIFNSLFRGKEIREGRLRQEEVYKHCITFGHLPTLSGFAHIDFFLKFIQGGDN